ncbi:conserved hypothetical protein [Neospora caninum Liverpool]|uniref:Integral membrane protein, DUF56 family protein,putative n=1 Tax=Neospora caninum (strain Liverpool) TaxID=572307 RepID=F0VNY6_NEOCL|nr:conserved hypothetical protein [Neospora caninum Liverpool]CBZ55432.1 conserved hypothetical protein [Neospora caninum Liverpool]CEL70168.1 TPA: integral membrane protein, DUF56 family protein,putative [Neospora caninum Liverpool]|eukprot:XP_003885460.1 conserved hypothetical protein [Neospora caninum Liverpool]
MGKLVVPSDISLLEEKQTVGRRRLTVLERLGLMTMAPMVHWNYTKNDKHDMRQVLQRQYDLSRSDPATDIVVRRQESIRKRVVAHNGVWAGVAVSTLLGHYSLRRYDYKTKLIVLPFLAYGGSWLGRFIANGLTGRWSEWGRDRALGALPPKAFFEG